MSIIADVVTVVISVGAVIVGIWKGISRTNERLTRLETKVELFWDSIKPVISQALIGKAPQNPISEERWEYLLNRFSSNTLTQAEALELREGFTEREKKAKEEKDAVTLLALGLGIALLAVILNETK